MIDTTFFSDINIHSKSKDYGNRVEVVFTGMTDDERVTLGTLVMFRDTAQQLVRNIEMVTGQQHLGQGEQVTETRYGMVPVEMHKAPRRMSKTVGELIDQLRRLPRSMPLAGYQDEGSVVQVYNVKSDPFADTLTLNEVELEYLDSDINGEEEEETED